MRFIAFLFDLDWSAIAGLTSAFVAGVALLLALRSQRLAQIAQERAEVHQSQQLRAQTLPVLQVLDVVLLEYGMSVTIQNVGVGPSRGGLVSLWVMLDTTHETPSPQEIADVKARAVRKRETSPPDLVESLPAIAPGYSQMHTLVYKDGRRNERQTTSPGWVEWATVVANVFDEQIEDGGGLSVNYTDTLTR